MIGEYSDDKKKSCLDEIPSDIKYYLLGWKDRNMDYFLKKYGSVRLRDFTFDQLQYLFSYATTQDDKLLSQLALK